MENNISEKRKISLDEIRENAKDDHWAKRYGVSAEELYEAGNELNISAKIIKVGIKNNAFVQ